MKKGNIINRVSAILVCFILITVTIAATLPQVNAEVALPLKISIDEDELKYSFVAGNIVLPIHIENKGDKLDSVSVTFGAPNSSFRDVSSNNAATITRTNYEAGYTENLRIPLYYDGRDQVLRISIIATFGGKTNTYVTNFIVSKATVNSTSSGGTESKPESTPELDADLYIKSVDTRIVSPGTSLPFNFTVANRTSTSANIVSIEVGDGGGGAMSSGATPTPSLFMFDEPSGKITRDVMTGTENISTRLKVAPGAADGAHKLNFSIVYQDKNGKKIEKSDSTIIYVQNRKENLPYLKSVSMDKKEVGKDNKAKITVNLTNPTGFLYTDLKIALNSTLTKEFTLYENFQPVAFDAMQPFATASPVYSIYMATTVVTGNYPIAFDISFIDGDGTLNSYTQVVNLLVTRTKDVKEEPEDPNKPTSTPRIIVSQYKSDVEEIKAGKMFKLDFTLQNTSATMAVKNMKVVVGSSQSTAKEGTGGGAASGSVFFPVAGSNSFFIENLGAKKTASNSIELMARQDVEPGVYNVTLSLDYEDKDGKPFKSEENIAFAVTQELRLEITGLNLPTDGMAGGSIPIEFQYINKGKSTVSNFSVTVEGDFILDGGDAYVGNLTAGFNDYFSSMIMPKGEGEQKGTIVLKYENSQGEPQEQRTEFKMNIAAMEMNGGMNGGMTTGDGSINMGGLPNQEGMMIDPKTGQMVPIKKGLSLVWIIVICVGALAIAGGVVWFIIHKKRKKKSLLDIDDE